VAEQSAISKSTVARYFALFGLQPHRSKRFKLSTDPYLCGKSARRGGTLPQPAGSADGVLTRFTESSVTG
jgi:hypothetical protein